MVPEIKNSLSEVKEELKFDADGVGIHGLKPLIDHIGDKKIVSTGEDTHGTSEFYKLSAELTKVLIKDKGFKTLVLENPYDGTVLLSQQLKTGNLEELMKEHLFSIYQTEEMKEFLTWLQSEGLYLSVKFKGCDDSYWVLNQLLEKEINAIEDSGLLALHRC